MTTYQRILGAALAVLTIVGSAGAFSTPSGSFSMRQISPSSIHQVGYSQQSKLSCHTRKPLYMSSDSAAVPAPEESSSSSSTATEPLFEGFGKGVLRDYKARLPLYKSDIKDGLNVQVSWTEKCMIIDQQYSLICLTRMCSSTTFFAVPGCDHVLVLCLSRTCCRIRRPLCSCYR